MVHVLIRLRVPPCASHQTSIPQRYKRRARPIEEDSSDSTLNPIQARDTIGQSQMYRRTKRGLMPLSGKWLAPCALPIMFWTDTLCFPGSDDEAPIQPRASKCARKAPTMNATSMSTWVKVEEGAMEKEVGSDFELFG